MVRVTRLMEYEYGTVEQALENMEGWAVPASGIRRFGVGSSNRGVIIRSAVIGPVYGEAADRIHSAVAAAEIEDDPIGVTYDSHAAVAVWRALSPGERTAVRRISEDLYDVLGRLSTAWGNR